MRKANSRGFSLIELAVVMVIIGILLVGILSAYTVQMRKQQVDTTRNNIVDAREALEKFAKDYGFYPCPADPGSTSTVATDCGAPVAGNVIERTHPDDPSTPLVDESYVIRIGEIPSAYLVPDDPATPDDESDSIQIVSGAGRTDGYKNRLLYAVTVDKTNPATFFAKKGKIVAKKPNGEEISSTADFILLSGGENKSSPFIADSCDASAVEGENCDGDDNVFVVATENDIKDTDNGRKFALGTPEYNDDFGAVSSSSGAPKTCPTGTKIGQIAGANGDEVCASSMSCDDPNFPIFGGLGIDGKPICKAATPNSGDNTNIIVNVPCAELQTHHPLACHSYDHTSETISGCSRHCQALGYIAGMSVEFNLTPGTFFQPAVGGNATCVCFAPKQHEDTHAAPAPAAAPQPVAPSGVTPEIYTGAQGGWVATPTDPGVTPTNPPVDPAPVFSGAEGGGAN